MKSLLLLGVAALVGVVAMHGGAALAANATTPYQNVDPNNDKGNATGDSRVDKLNNNQLDENQPHAAQQPALGQNPVVVVPMTQPQPGQTTVVVPAR